jgi:Holliday junction DNA helicase RuvA
MVSGILTGVEKDRALVEINGITYGIFISRAVAERLIATGKIGEEVTFHTFSYIEGNPALGNLIPRMVGFPNRTDLDFFSMLTTVQGLGVKKALRALTIPVKDVARAIELDDVATLKKLPEIGGKTAQKIVMELKGKAARFALLREEEIQAAGMETGMEEEYLRDAVDILIQLQYTQSEAENMVRQAVKAHPGINTAEELIQEIFKRQMGAK